MKAIIYEKYGTIDVLQLAEVEKPVPRENEVLVEVHAASVNVDDLDRLRGQFAVGFGGSRGRRYKILGSDIAGRVAAVGDRVEQFRPGDEVFGDLTGCGFGAFAEYACAPEKALASKPPRITFEEAAAAPSRAIIALQGLRSSGGVRPGQKVLINGASGGVGTFAVQIARHYGAEVTAVGSAGKLDLARLLGADHVIDYARADFTRNWQRYDRILDVAAHRSISDYRRALNPGGICLLVGGSAAAILQALFLGPLISLAGGRKIGLLIWRPFRKEDVDALSELLGSGKVKPVIDRRYPLSKVPEALRYLEEGRARGKVVITVRENNMA